MTPQILDELARMYPHEVRIVHHPENRGYGGALRSGFAAASKQFLFYTDGDAQYDPSEMALLWQRMADDVDLVNGYKISRSDPVHQNIRGRCSFIFHLPEGILERSLKIKDDYTYTAFIGVESEGLIWAEPPRRR